MVTCATRLPKSVQIKSILVSLKSSCWWAKEKRKSDDHDSWHNTKRITNKYRSNKRWLHSFHLMLHLAHTHTFWAHVFSFVCFSFLANCCCFFSRRLHIVYNAFSLLPVNQRPRKEIHVCLLRHACIFTYHRFYAYIQRFRKTGKQKRTKIIRRISSPNKKGKENVHF